MQITHEQVEPFWETLECRSFQPPRAAVAALFALAAPIDPEDVHVGAIWAHPGNAGSVKWTLLALTAGGLAITTATADDQWDWSREWHRKPVNASVHARWVPLSQVRGVALEVAEVESSGPQERGSHYGLQFRGSWTLQLADGEQIRLTADESEGGSSRLARFMGRVRSALR